MLLLHQKTEQEIYYFPDIKNLKFKSTVEKKEKVGVGGFPAFWRNKILTAFLFPGEKTQEKDVPMRKTPIPHSVTQGWEKLNEE